MVVNYAGNANAAQETVKDIITKGGKAVAIQADVSSEADVGRLFSEAKAVTGHLDVVVHSAGVMPMAKITPAGLADFDKVIHTNLRGAFWCWLTQRSPLAKAGALSHCPPALLQNLSRHMARISHPKQALKVWYMSGERTPWPRYYRKRRRARPHRDRSVL